MVAMALGSLRPGEDVAINAAAAALIVAPRRGTAYARWNGLSALRQRKWKVEGLGTREEEWKAKHPGRRITC